MRSINLPDQVDDTFFTQDRLAQLDEAIAEAESGKWMSVEALDSKLAAQAKVWRATRAL
jgi:hypothetical protein